MMNSLKNPVLSVICVFRNRKEWIEPTLNALYSIKKIPCEFIFIDDASGDGTSETLPSIIEHHQHDQTFFYHHETLKGRGNSINMALEQVSGRFLWIPEHLNRVHEEELLKALESLRSSDALFAVAPQGAVPASPLEWLQQLQNDRIAYDRDHLFDLEKVRTSQKFTDPHWQSRHAAEWAIRLHAFSDPLQVTPFSEGEKRGLLMDNRTRKEVVLALLRMPGLSVSEQEKAFRLLRSYGHPLLEEDTGETETLYQEAQNLVNSGDRPGALEILNRILATDHDHKKARSFKISILEKMRRFVEAAEVKHGQPAVSEKSSLKEEKGISGEKEGSESQEETARDGTPSEKGDPLASAVSEKEKKELRQQLPLTIIIPTATNNKPLLEDALSSVFRYSMRDKTEVIVVNNASVDDTPEYVEQLQKKKYPIKIINNSENCGFATAVNQALDRIEKGMVMVMHNDVVLKSPVPARLALALYQNPDIGLIAPRTKKTWNEIQRIKPGELPGHQSSSETELFTNSEILEGYFFAFRKEDGIRMSQKYGQAFFEDADFCLRMKKKGFRVVVANREEVKHLSRRTTEPLGLTMRGKTYWKNAAIFKKTWKREPQVLEEWKKEDPLMQQFLIGKKINPFFPEKQLLDHFLEIFTSEQKTRVLKEKYSFENLKAMIRLMMAAEQRDVLRKLEEQLESHPQDEVLIHNLITFYFDRTIYSRCKKYLDIIGKESLPPDFWIYRLKIALGEKDYHLASGLIHEMMKYMPLHREVLLAVAEIHRLNGNRTEKERFIALAKKIHPGIKA